MRVLFIVPHPIEGPSSRFRVYQYLPFLRASGVEAVARPFLSSRLVPVIYREGAYALKACVTAWGTALRVLDVLAARNYDVAYVLREAFPFGPPFFERALEAAAGRLIFDFDDAIYMPSLAYPNPLDRWRDFGKPAKIIRRASWTVVGSDYLKAYALRHAPDPARVAVVPTVVDTDQYAPRHRAGGNAGCVIGWIGTPRGSSYLRELTGAIGEVARACPGTSFKFVGAEPFDVGALPVTFKSWRLDEEVADIQSFDIGIMPLTDDEETRGKCGFKLVQYMSCGVPAVCSPVGANLSILEDGGSGYFARQPEQWSALLCRLVSDGALRARLARRGRELVEARFSLKAMAPRLLSVLEQAAS